MAADKNPTSSPWLPSALTNPAVLGIAGGALVGLAAGAAAASMYWRRLAGSGAASGTARWAAAASRSTALARGAADAALKQEQLSRNRQFFGDAGQDAVESAFVVVVGLGGVGSHAAHMLARSGVRKLRLVDFDIVTSSSLNRHAVATREDVGKPKVASLKRVLAAVVPWVEVEAVAEKFDADSASTHLAGEPDYVLDCIDDMDTKAALLSACKAAGLRVLASMGAGGRCDPTALRLTHLDNVAHDPLALRLRTVLRKGAGLRDSELHGPKDPAAGIRTVYAGGAPAKGLLPLSAEQAAAPEEFGTMEGMRLRIMPVLGTLPAMFGQAMATVTLCDLAGEHVEVSEFPAVSNKALRSYKTKFMAGEKPDGGDGKPPLFNMSVDDVEYLVCTVWKQKSAVSGALVHTYGSRMVLARWDKDAPISLDNIVLVTSAEAKRLRSEGNAWVDPQRAAWIQSRLAFAAQAFYAS